MKISATPTLQTAFILLLTIENGLFALCRQEFNLARKPLAEFFFFRAKSRCSTNCASDCLPCASATYTFKLCMASYFNTVWCHFRQESTHI